jgi:hypothetical protein
MPLPPDVQAAKDRMDRAKAALRADVESGTETARARRRELIDQLQRATDDYMEKLGGR